MDKNFQDLLVRYVNGHCTPEEIEKVNQWYEEIEDRSLQLDAAEREQMKARILENIQKTLPAHDGFFHKYGYTSTLLKIAAAIVLVTVCGLWLFTGSASLPDNSLSEIPKTSGEVIFENQSDKSQEYKLSDGSTVKLEPSGKIRFSKNFSAGKREVYLTGKAFFDVTKDLGRPFYVYSGTIATRVLGTSFFVDAPVNTGKVEVKVITGKVSVFQITSNRSSKNEDPSMVRHSAANGVVLSPNQKVEYFIDDEHWVTGLVENPIPIIKPEEEQTLPFMFDNTPMKEVLTEINERYGIEVLTENEKIYGCTFTGDVSRMSLYDMLDVISNSIGSTYEIKGTRILVSGKGCN